MPRNLLSGASDDARLHLTAFVSTPSPEDAKATGGGSGGGGYMIANNGRVFFAGDSRIFETREFGLRAARGRFVRCKTRRARSAQ